MSQCISLQSSRVCPEYAQYSIGAANAPFNTTATFDAWFTTNFGTAAGFAAYTKAVQKCDASSTYTAAQMRYVQSVQCYFLVDAASENGCANGQTPTPMCRGTVQTFSQQYTTDLGPGSTSCTSASPPTSNPVNYFQILTQKSLNDTATCVPGLDVEIKQCGFYTLDAAKTFCAANPKEPCCSSSTLGGSETTLSKLVPAVANSNSGSSSSTSSNIWSTGSLLFNKGIIVGVAFAAFVGLLSLILIIVLINKRKKSRKTAVDQQFSGGTADFNSTSPLPNAFSSPQPMPSNARPADETMQVLYNYVPNLQDEIYLYVGDPVVIKAKL